MGVTFLLLNLGDYLHSPGGFSEELRMHSLLRCAFECSVPVSCSSWGDDFQSLCRCGNHLDSVIPGGSPMSSLKETLPFYVMIISLLF